MTFSLSLFISFTLSLYAFLSLSITLFHSLSLSFSASLSHFFSLSLAHFSSLVMSLSPVNVLVRALTLDCVVTRTTSTSTTAAARTVTSDMTQDTLLVSMQISMTIHFQSDKSADMT